MDMNIVGLTIEVVGHRAVELPRGHLLATQIGSPVATDLRDAHHISVTPLFAGGAGSPIQMSYCGRGSCRDVWAGEAEQLGGRVFLKVTDLRWEQHNEEEFLALQMLRGEIRAPEPLWLGRASILQVDRGCLLATSGGTDAVVALNGCLRSQETLLCVAQWAVDFLARAIDFLTGAMEQGIFPGNSWTLRQCCVDSPVPGPPSELVLVDAKGLQRIADVRKLHELYPNCCYSFVRVHRGMK